MKIRIVVYVVAEQIFFSSEATINLFSIFTKFTCLQSFTTLTFANHFQLKLNLDFVEGTELCLVMFNRC